MSFSGETFEETAETPATKNESGFVNPFSSLLSDASSRLALLLAAVVPAVIVLIICLAVLPSSTSTPSVATDLNNGVAMANSGNYLRAEADYIQAVLGDPTNANGYRALAYYDLGVCFQRTSFPDVAIAYYDKSLALNPNDVSAWYNLGIAQTSTPAAALVDYNKALKLDPTYPQALLNAGLVQYTIGQKAAGLVRINKAITLDPALKSRVPAGINLSK